MFGVRYPIVSAPMGGSAGGALAAAVSRGGGLGLLGAGDGNRELLAREMPLVADCGRPWGVGFLTWATEVAAVERALEYRPHAVMLSFGDPTPYVERIRAAGTNTKVILQVTDPDEARQALDLGADVVVAQGTESGGHGARHGMSTLAFVPVVVDLADAGGKGGAGPDSVSQPVPVPVPVLAAGGIGDGRGVAAVLALGAAGALLGTRFQATAESLADPSIVKAVVEGKGQDTERNSVLDIARGATAWSASKYTARTLGHPYLDRWRGREAELAASPEAQQAYRDDVLAGTVPPLPVWAGEAVALVTDRPPATELVERLAAEAAEALERAAGHRRTARTPPPAP
ncbi:nitronate monooxygenase [Streptomyces cylindrosporus]|uniref:Nitronate monooxygenase n=1 Tax=Streptomyces cylindrosporus TaxID=2927583 RepID=A0ABS9YIQ5_9ACTN|nr:nitronate monooxygenase [Streptomyces cylindrosporus]MCI3276461.1 nitronate monooxygenase [Streptomyces cylindrosporus]